MSNERVAEYALGAALADVGLDRSPPAVRLWRPDDSLVPGRIYYSDDLSHPAEIDSSYRARMEPQVEQLAWLPRDEETAAVMFNAIMNGHPSYHGQGDLERDAYLTMVDLNLLSRLANHKHLFEKLKREGREGELVGRLKSGVEAAGRSKKLHYGAWQIYNRALELLVGMDLGLENFRRGGEVVEKEARYVSAAVMQLLERHNELPAAARRFSETGIGVFSTPDDISDLYVQFGSIDPTFNPVTGNLEYRRQKRVVDADRIHDTDGVLGVFYDSNNDPRAFEANYSPWSLADRDTVNRAFHRAQAGRLPLMVLREHDSVAHPEAPKNVTILVQSNMVWDPLNPDVHQRGNFDKAYLIAERTVQELLPKGSRVTVYRMRDGGYTSQTVREMNDAELILAGGLGARPASEIEKYGDAETVPGTGIIARGGTAEVPISEITHSLEGGESDLTIYIGDMNVRRPEAFRTALMGAAKKPKRLIVYHLDTNEPLAHYVADNFRRIGGDVYVIHQLDTPHVVTFGERSRTAYDAKHVLLRGS